MGEKPENFACYKLRMGSTDRNQGLIHGNEEFTSFTYRNWRLNQEISADNSEMESLSHKNAGLNQEKCIWGALGAGY